MIVRSLTLHDDAKKIVSLNNAGECAVVQLQIDAAEFLAEYPGCVIELLIENPQGVVYRRTPERDGNMLLYTVKKTDTLFPGYGVMQLYAKGTSGEERLSNKWRTYIAPSLLLEEVTEPPAPIAPMIEEVENIRDEAKSAAARASESEQSAGGYAQQAAESATSAAANAEKAEAAAAKAETATGEIKSITAFAETLEPGEQATATYENGNLRFGIPKGMKGDKGDTYDDSEVRADISELNEDIQTLSNDGRINIEGTDHNYYFGGGPNYSDLIISNLTFTKVFPIEPGKTYHVINSGNTCTIGFANEEYTEGGKLSDNVVKSERIFDFTNDGKYTFLYVSYSKDNKEKQGDCLLEVYTNIVLKELFYKKTTEDYNVLNQFISLGFNKITPADENIRKGYFVSHTGSLIANDRSDAHTDIKVRRGYKIRIKNAYCAYSRSICAYKENGDYVKTLATNMGESAFNAEFDVDNYDKISVTSKSNEEIAIEYIGIIPIQATDLLCESIDEGNATSKGTGNYYNLPAFVLDQGEFTDGYLAANSVFESTALYYSPYIPVLDEQVITLKNAFVGGYTKAVFYDADKKYIGYVKSDDNYYTATYEVKIPYGAHYMRFNVNKATDFSLVGVEYTQKIERNYKSLNLTKRWYSDSYEKIDQLFKKATEKPICCIIDDDTPSADAMETFATVMENNGVQGTIACLTSVMNSHQDLKSKLLELERRGHQIVLHGYTQNEAYKTAANIGDENYKIAEDDFVHGLHDLISAGFVNCKFWVTPYGVSQKCLQQLAQKWGMECLITTAKKEFNRTDGKFSRYEIQRSGLNAADTGALSQAELIELADKCAAENGWLLVNTHITDGWNKDFTRINEFISHCKGKGFEFMTLGEAWIVRKPIYDWYDTF